MSYQNTNPKMNHQAGNVLFVADLPEDCSEEDLMNVFKQHHLTVCKVTNRMAKSFALAHFESPEWAEKARNDLNGIKVEAKYSKSKIPKPIRLCRWETKQSISERKEDDYKKNLLVKNLSKDISAVMIWNTFKQYGDIRSSKLAIDYQGVSKGYAYVTYYDTYSAERAKELLNNKEMYGKSLQIDFLMPGMRKAIKKNNIYVKHIPTENFTDDDLRKLFETYGELISVMIVPDGPNQEKNKGFGFVCFKNPEDAEKAQRDLNGKKLWEALPSLYVSFAMKKEERHEHLIRQREELLKSSYKQTIFCKIKEGVLINSNDDLISEIMLYLTKCFGESYTPRSLKPKIETRNAFITMNSPVEVQTLIGFVNNLSKTSPVNLYFNQYKSRMERLQAMNQMKKYNEFGMDQGMGMQMNNPNMQMQMKPPSYKNYNDFGGMNMNMNPNMNMMNMNMNMNNYMNPGSIQQQPRYQNYNNFDQPMSNPMVNEMNLMNLNNQMGQMNLNQVNQFQMNQIQHENEDDLKGEILDKIYTKAYEAFNDDAPKITGMIAELSLNDLNILISDEMRLQEVLKSAYNQLHN